MTAKSESQGLSLLDIGIPFELVPIGDKKLRVQGLSSEDVTAIFARFPDALKWLSPGGLKPEDMVKIGPEAIAAVIAAASGMPGNPEAESVARALPVEAQLDVLAATGRLTFKSGFGPFVQRIVALAVEARSVSYGKATDTSLPQGSKD